MSLMYKMLKTSQKVNSMSSEYVNVKAIEHEQIMK